METLGGLIETAQVVENDGAVEEGFGVAIVDFEGRLELFERTLRFPHHGQTKPRPIAYVGEVGMVVEDGLEVLVRIREVVPLPGGIPEGQRLRNRQWPGVGSGAHWRALVVGGLLSLSGLHVSAALPESAAGGSHET